MLRFPSDSRILYNDIVTKLLIRSEMDYQQVTLQNKIDGITNRLGQLESEHYTQEVFLLEAGAVGDKQAVVELSNKKNVIETSIKVLREELEKLNKTANKNA